MLLILCIRNMENSFTAFFLNQQMQSYRLMMQALQFDTQNQNREHNHNNIINRGGHNNFNNNIINREGHNNNQNRGQPQQ